MQTCIVEEVMKNVLMAPTIGALFDDTRRDGVPMKFVVYANSQAMPATWLRPLGDIELKGGVAPLVTPDLLIVEPHGGPVGGRIEA